MNVLLNVFYSLRWSLRRGKVYINGSPFWIILIFNVLRTAVESFSIPKKNYRRTHVVSIDCFPVKQFSDTNITRMLVNHKDMERKFVCPNTFQGVEKIWAKLKIGSNLKHKVEDFIISPHMHQKTEVVYFFK